MKSKRGFFDGNGYVKIFVFLMLVVVCVGVVDGQCGPTGCPVPPPTGGGSVSQLPTPPESTWGDGSGLEDEKKWEEDKTEDGGDGTPDKDQPEKWSEYDKTHTTQLSGDQLKDNEKKATELFNTGKLSDSQMEQFSKDIATNTKLEIGEGTDLKGAHIDEEGRLWLKGQKTPIPLKNEKLGSFNVDAQGRLELTTTAGTKLVFDGANLVGGTPGPRIADVPANMPQQPSRPGSPQQAGGGGGGQQGGGGGGQQGGGQDMQMLQQLLGLIQTIAGAIPKDEGQTNVNGNDELAFSDGGGAYLPEAGADVEQNCYTGYGENGECLDQPSTIRAYGENSLMATNADIFVPEQVIGYTPSDIETEVQLAGITGDSPEALASASQLEAEYGMGSSLITAAAISDLGGGQYIKLIGHDLGLGGTRVLVDVLKSYEEIQGDGSELWVKNGDMYAKFDGMKIYYSRRIKDSPHSFTKISNVRDDVNTFSLIEYKENKARLMDARKRVTVGDLSVNHPRTEGLNVAKVREDMWVER